MLTMTKIKLITDSGSDISVETAEKFSRAEDFETGKKLSLANGNMVEFSLRKHDFRLIKFYK